MIVKKIFRCKHCHKENEYSSDEILYDHLICKTCGEKITGIIKWLDQVNMDYLKVGNT